ncbi:hypothetical protein XENTR_v10019981 [Xenopus tropicalis]|uniref:Uncharacterized protein LOC100485040 isoform X2 n=1 Tax=Xenopus tropicalis TaxID=8364 RepID=A0A8J0QTK3_XENTR|nr:uncharacterized protein LOC100485040 isoform X2 [Xenopus tropicalis]KAE8582171.1 hypothetical protein XENTR_v10019981 [Xenopus tropicalis]|eukprot:XP_002942021.3 PREDICTED: uncharacterized protein LOC100485040 [Xenopus tropicalis]
MVAQEPVSQAPGMEEILPTLLSPQPHVVLQAVEQITSAIQTNRNELAETLMNGKRCRKYMETLCRLLHSSDIRLCSNVAYILGTVAEDQAVAVTLVELAEASEGWDMLARLGAMLLWDDTEAVMNSAGALGTLAETSNGRHWLLCSPNSDFIIENITALLSSPNDWTASNCALVLARIAMSQEGCSRLIAHPQADIILKRLISSLRADEAGCGLNAAFALGRLCDTDVGRTRVLSLPEANAMVAALGEMMSAADEGGSRNACFALTCLAADQAGHQHVLQSPHFPPILDTLCCLLQSEEQESCWFAAMTVKVLSSQAKGVVRLRQNQRLEAVLKKVSGSHHTGKEVLEEVEQTLKNLQRLPHPAAPQAKRLDSGSVWVSWEGHRVEIGCPVTYRLYDGERLLYRGPSCSFLAPQGKPGQQYHLKVVMETEVDQSPDSPVTVLSMEEPLPSSPRNFQAIGRTSTQMKLGWSPPADRGATIKYYIVYQGDAVIETTPELSCIVGGLSPGTKYMFSVCACTSTGHSQKVPLVAKTMDNGDHAPGKLNLYVIGRSEIFITWEGPKAPLGRFFNYELCLNGKAVYLGTERSYTARRLVPNMEYTCTVCAITSEGRFESRPITKRTAKDEYVGLSRSNAYGSLGAGKTSRTKDKKVNTSKSRRDSILSWTTESSDGAEGSTKPESHGDVTSPRPQKKIQQNNKRGPERTASSQGKRTQAKGNVRRSPKLAKQSRAKGSEMVGQATASADNRKLQNAMGLRPVPVASLCNLTPEDLLLQRAKTDSALMWCQGQGMQEDLGEANKDGGPRKPLQPIRDPTLRFRHRNQAPRAWDGTGPLKAGEGTLPRSVAPTTNEEDKGRPKPECKGLMGKDALMSRVAGLLTNRHPAFSQLSGETTQRHNLGRKPVTSVKGYRIRGSLPENIQRGTLTLVGYPGIGFRPAQSAYTVGSQSNSLS